MYDPRHPVRHELRDYFLARTFGYTLQEIDDQPAVWLDWMLAIDGKMREVEADAARGEG